jgi:hypothetical protein
MVNQRSVRLLKVNHILHLMDCQYKKNSDFDLNVDGDLCHLSLPDDEPNVVYISFTSKAGKDLILETAIKFSVTATHMGLEVYPAGTIAPDSNDAMADWITNKKEI